ncbi:hypothetical protein B0H63DRAFT_60239 [Podospora didyma]|uniref:Uncharacterized protein n=1 Tax=Podospora didyma TaxID=330526 RepID=A0AAE0U8V4_9PEZI|nr:hypothetical protein B0H63DRAFT_60239 [Podospora didyma]
MATPSGLKAPKPVDAGAVSAPGRPASTFKVTPVPVPKPGSVPSLPPSANNAAAAARASSNTAVPARSTTPVMPQSSAGFGLLAPAEANLQDATSGPHRDGRIRNPVPSKLKGKTDGSKGNFSVMHMEVAGRNEATERDAQAKRTSESTELAAKLAFQNGYVSLRRNRFVHVPDDLVVKPFVPAATTPAPDPASSPSSRRSTLGPEETKSEQARLLTLLRSLQPILVVDQICKALAFFGGIPGAPPPVDGLFPQSAEANGSGGLFIGWIAEIFPKLGGNSAQQALSDVQRLDMSEFTRRRRGRPKGSKATKSRRDKGMKKGTGKPTPGSDISQPGGDVDESWADLEENSMEISDDVEKNVLLLAQAASPRHISQLHAEPEAQEQSAGPEHLEAAIETSARTALPGAPVGNDITTNGNSSTKKRGRPKGSKNRPKEPTSASLDSLGEAPPLSPVARASQTQMTLSKALEAPRLSQPPVGNPSFTAVNSATATPANKKVSAKTKGPVNHQGLGEKLAGAPVGTVGYAPADLSSVGQAQPSPSSAHQTVQNLTYQAPQATPGSQGQAPSVLALPALPTPPTPSIAGPAQAKLAGNTGQKRKRKSAKDSSAVRLGASTEGAGLVPSAKANGLTLPTPPKHPVPELTKAAGITVGPPPPKRQRKAKDPRLPSKKQSDASICHVAAVGAAPVPTGKPSPVVAPNSSPRPAATPVATMLHATKPESIPALVPTAVGPAVSSAHSPHHGHFEVQSPTMNLEAQENYEAQLQAQQEQQAEAESSPMTTQNRGDSRQLLTNHLQQHQQQFQQRQQQHIPAVQSRSPNPQLQQPKSQTGSPMIPQQQTRTSQSHYSQYRPPNSQYSQHQHQQNYPSASPSASASTPLPQKPQPQAQQAQQSQQPQNAQQPQQLQQTPQAQHHAPPPPPSAPLQQQFTGQQQAAQVSVQQSQPYLTNSQHSQQFGTSQPQYSTSQQQYSNGQQQHATQQRYQQQLVNSSAGTASYTAHHSPQFSTSTSSDFSPTDGNYRSSAAGLNTSYSSQRSQSSTPTSTTAYRANATHNVPPHHSSSFGAGSTAGQQRSTSTTQNMQNLTGVQPYSSTTPTDWHLFDTSNLDTSGSQGTLGLSNTGYPISSANGRAAANPGTSYATGTLANFNTSGLGGSGDRYYGAGRR